ncbi:MULTISPECIES: TIGR04086 family membrane protein [Clostridium]|uniref:Putative membrane protein, TIGR04086 family n=1 Tax=Clostridium cadaveris TaxID=1529 RepID=A0A1I2MPX7_9CLOT|nr:TIGR04086 family membrane protein [Clostridium cadaveris]MDU4951056.1 TIGR04086 family membrane protein [Clostridium sp.]MDM8311657.1 TIGR04086 family membrane protein [Clostridium cadaveris]MDY4948302.1 TIGR04086 family membrane protein [Clostridium cadaveris]NME65049.1 TIGR04086 family membrane protein [Clostridium cadaveris]NWK12548.1 TIGR04086 family membrane protein [Clostridium cadaveris]
MEKSEFFFNISKGVLRSVIVTTILLAIYSILMNFVDFSMKTVSVVYMVITCVSIVYGAIYASKTNGHKGWISGLSVSALYMLILLIITALINGGLGFSSVMVVQIMLALGVGTLSGMLGINI